LIGVRLPEQVTELGQVLRPGDGVLDATGDIEILDEGHLVRLYHPAGRGLLLRLAHDVPQLALRGGIGAAQVGAGLLGRGRLPPIAKAHLRVQPPRRRDLQHVIQPEGQPALHAAEIVLQIPRLRQGVDMLQAQGVPVATVATVALPAQVRRRGKAKAPAQERHMVGRAPVDGGQ